MNTTLSCGCSISWEYGDCTCCGCPARDRTADGICRKHEGLTMSDFVGNYGVQGLRLGVLTEHLSEAKFVGLQVRETSSGRKYVTDPNGGAGFPVVCSELVSDGGGLVRCGHAVYGGNLTCLRH